MTFFATIVFSRLSAGTGVSAAIARPDANNAAKTTAKRNDTLAIRLLMTLPDMIYRYPCCSIATRF